MTTQIKPESDRPLPLHPFEAPTTLTAYWPERPNAARSAIVVLPGGGYNHLANHEGSVFARWLNESGVAAFVLHYRLGSQGYRHPAMLDDAARAVRHVRAHAVSWEIDPGKIGIIGCSAGGHLAATLLTHCDSGNPSSDDPVERVGSRPDCAILCYPVISMVEMEHRGSIDLLLGENPSRELLEELSADLRVTPQTPPCFLWHTWEDGAVPVEHSLRFASALRRSGVPFDLHIYQKGGHGMGLGQEHPWASQCLHWLREQAFIA